MTFAFMCHFDESIASHILDTFMCFMHKLKQLVDDSLQEFPVSSQESWILSYHVHDIRCYH